MFPELSAEILPFDSILTLASSELDHIPPIVLFCKTVDPPTQNEFEPIILVNEGFG